MVDFLVTAYMVNSSIVHYVLTVFIDMVFDLYRHVTIKYLNINTIHITFEIHYLRMHSI